MCGRISQARDLMDYAESIGMPPDAIFDIMPPPRRFNVAPGSKVLGIHMLDGEHYTAEPMRWGYHSGWAKMNNRDADKNAKLEKALGRYWKPLWKHGRVIVPADGWYEWTGEKPNKQPWFIRPKDQGPMFIAAVSNWKADPEERAEDAGFALVTWATEGGMVDIHARRPVVLTAKDAREWIDLANSAEYAEEMARTNALQEDMFEWYQVTKAVGSYRNDGPEMVKPISPTE